MRAYVDQKIRNNVGYYSSQYLGGPGESPLGLMLSGGAIAYQKPEGVRTGIAAWQQDFFTIAFSSAYFMGYPEIKDFALYLVRFQVGRMMAPDYCYIHAAPYAMFIRSSESSPPFTTWGEVYAATVSATVRATECGSQAMATAIGGGLVAGEMTGYSSGEEGYPSNMQPALAIAVDLGAPLAAEAWAKFQARPVKPDYGKGPAYAIIPRK
jgi:hypothetical protein